MYSLDIGYGIRIIGLSYGSRFEATRWETDDQIDALEKTTFPEQFMLAKDIVYVHAKGDVTIPLDASLLSKSIAVEVILPSINDFDTAFFQYKAGVRFQNRWNFFDMVVLVCNAHHLEGTINFKPLRHVDNQYSYAYGVFLEVSSNKFTTKEKGKQKRSKMVPK